MPKFSLFMAKKVTWAKFILAVALHESGPLNVMNLRFEVQSTEEQTDVNSEKVVYIVKR